MSSQRFRLERLVYAAAVLAFNLVLPVPAVAAAAPGVSAPVELRLMEEPAVLLVEVATLEQGQSLPTFKLSSAFQAADLAGGDPIGGEVDPWDDDLDGKKPGGATAGDDLCGMEGMDDHGDFPRCATSLFLRLARALAAGRYFLEVESPNGDDAVYRLILHRP
jgi:hypothetical protein